MIVSADDLSSIVSGDIEPVLPIGVREAMLDLILAWANLDMATAFVAALTNGLDPDEGADKFGRKIIADKLKATSKALTGTLTRDDVQLLSRISTEYPAKALLRKRVAHSGCVGVRRSDPAQIVFMPYEREGPPGNLAVQIYHCDEMIGATEWARTAHSQLMGIVGKANFFEPAP